MSLPSSSSSSSPATERPDEPFPDYYNDLALSLHHAWQSIGRATKDRKSAFHAPVLATTSAQGPQARVLVLRAADADARTLTFYSDTRSSKMADLAADPRIAVTFYDAARKLQVRATGHATLHTDSALAERCWSNARLSSLRCYLGATPGAMSAQASSGLPDALQGAEPTAAEVAAGQPYFAVLQVQLQRMEWLYLHSRGQRRAAFAWHDGAWAMQWLNP